MPESLALIALGLLLVVALIMFLNELYYRKRISALGVIVLVSSVYLMWYMHQLNGDILECITELAKYQPVKIHKGL